MQQSSATQSLHLNFWRLRKIVAYSHSSSQCLLVPTVFGTVSSLHPTSFLMTCNIIVTCQKSHGHLSPYNCTASFFPSPNQNTTAYCTFAAGPCSVCFSREVSG